MGLSLACVVALLFMSTIYSNGSEVMEFMPSGGFEQIQLEKPFLYAGKWHDQLFLNMDGFLSFVTPKNDEIPDHSNYDNIIAPLCTDVDEGRNITYVQATNGSLIDWASSIINSSYPEHDFSASFVFIATWSDLPVGHSAGVASLQVALISDSEAMSFIVMNYSSVSELSSYWLAGYGMEGEDFVKIPVDDASRLSLTSNVNVSGFWIFEVDELHFAPDVPDTFYPFWNGDDVNEDFSEIILSKPFQYFGISRSRVYVSSSANNLILLLVVTKYGFLSFSPPVTDSNDTSVDLVASLWTEFETDDDSRIVYKEVTSHDSLSRASEEINTMFPEINFTASWLFITTWYKMLFQNDRGRATFQLVLVSDGDKAFALMNYGEINSTDQQWKAGFQSAESNDNYIIKEHNTSLLSMDSNVGSPGCWAFRIDVHVANCESLNCSWDEVCERKNGFYGCSCAENNEKRNPDIFDAIETCEGSSGSLSLSRCQIFDAGYSSDLLHLNDKNCRGTIEENRLVFYFDSNENQCGTVLEGNKTHVIYKNAVGSTDQPVGIISRVNGLDIAFSCVYPITQNISMPMEIEVSGSLVSKELSTEAMYDIHMVPYLDSSFQSPLSGNVTLDVNQQLYIAVHVEGFEGSQIATVLDGCWATPVNDIDYFVRWDLIINDCPNPDDTTVKVQQNGVSTYSYFSFRMFTFTGYSSNIFLHCNVHLCLLDGGNCAQICNEIEKRRRRRSADIHDSASISMKF